MGARRSIDLITIDLGLPGMRKREGLRDLRVQYPEVRIVVVTASRDREMVLDALGAGVHGYLPTDFPVHAMEAALRTVLAGHIYVPHRQSVVLGTIGSGRVDLCGSRN